MEGAQGVVARLSSGGAVATWTVEPEKRIRTGDALTHGADGCVRVAKKGERVFGFAVEDFDPWPDNCVVIEEEFDAPT